MLLQTLRRPLRFALCSMGVAIGVAVGLIVVSYATAIQAGLQGAGWVRGSDFTLGFLADGRGLPRLFNRQALASLEIHPKIRETAAMGITVWSLDKGLPLLVYGIEPTEFLWKDFFPETPPPKPTSSTEIYIGRVAARRLELTIGSQLHLAGQTFTVAGIFDPPSPMDSAAAILPLATWQSLLDQGDMINFIQLRLRDNLSHADRENFRKEIERTYSGLVAVPSGDFGQSFVQLQTAEALAWTLALIAIVTGLSGVFNAVRVNLWERRAEVALLSALGWKRSQIQALLFGEAFLPAAVGTALGIILALTVFQIFQILQWPSELFHPSLSLHILVTTTFAVHVLAFLGTLPTVWKASHPSPMLLSALN